MASRRVTRRPLQVGALAALAIVSACADPFPTTRTPPARGTVGQELYGVVCDRIGAQSLHEDLTGSSFQAVCHPDTSGNYTAKVDQTRLPDLNPAARDTDGNLVSMSVQAANRTYAVARVEALARRRQDLISSFDAIFPATQVNVVDNGNADPAKSCTPKGKDSFGNQLTELLARFQPLYGDGTIPQSTESLASIFNAIKASPEAQAAFARFEKRQGYRPIELTLGIARPAIAYPGLRDLANAALALLASDSQPYNTSKVDPSGKRVAIPGPANAQFNALIAAAHAELKYTTQDPAPPLLVATADNTTDAIVKRTILNRPRTDLELLENLFYATDRDPKAYGLGGAPTYITVRDPRGYAQVHSVLGAIPAPFLDTNSDGLADVDNAGNFLTSDGSIPPSPFFAVGTATTTPRDPCGRALRTGGGVVADGGAVGADAGGTSAPDSCGTPLDSLVYDSVETSNVFATSLLRNLKPLANPDPAAHHETLMYALAGAPVLFGARDGSPKSSKCYNPDPSNPSSCTDTSSLLKYDAFETESSALLDLVYAVGQMLGDPTMDATLAYVSALFKTQVGSLARIAGDGLAMKATADQHPEAKIPAASTFWDEMLDLTVKLEKEPGLLEDVLKSLGADGSKDLGHVFASYMTYRDQVSYDPSNLNGPPLDVTLGAPAQMATPVDRAKPDTGFNRSAMQRFMALIHDTNGVTACNTKGAIVHAKGLPIFGAADVCGSSNGQGALCNIPLLNIGARPFEECEIFKIENLAKFYLDSIVGKATIYFRPPILRNGLCVGTLCVGAATVSMIEQSSGLGWAGAGATAAQLTAMNAAYGFWDDTSSQTFRPRPQLLDRMVFFDQANDSPTSGGANYLTNHFLADLAGPNIGTAVCPERTITDPTPSAADASPDGLVHGLRSCQDGDWVGQRDKDTIFVWEQFNFYASITPILSAFVNHGREDIFIDLIEIMTRHWADAQGTANECRLSADPAAKYPQCTKDGLVTYEPLLVQNFEGDLFPALHDLEPTLESLKVSSCTTVDPKTAACTASEKQDGIAVLASATRGLVDPAQALAIGLVDRHGGAKGQRNDGSTNPQVTPIYLLTQALNGVDAAFVAAPSTDPNDDRFAQWRLSRSQLVDQFLKVDGTGAASTFDNVAIPKFVPTFIEALRAQILAQCPTTALSSTRCAWARDTLTTELTNVVHGPVFAATMDLLEAFRKDPTSRPQFGQLLQYLLNEASQNDALSSMLATANDIIQLMKDDTNLVPLYKALAPAFEPTKTDAQGNVTQKNAIDASLALLGRLSGRALDAKGNEVCSAELDPNQILTIALQNLVTPVAGPTGQIGQAPLQTIMDAIGDVNRADPSQAGPFQATDYANIADNVSSFLLDPTNGLEQFYAIVKNGTVE